MSREYVTHREINQFAVNKVNLPKDKAFVYRDQARRLREKLDGYVKENPDFSLKKMLISGSLAKGTALRSLNDIDVACYVSGSDVPKDIESLLSYIAERLRKAFPNFKPEQVQQKTYCVTVSFRGTGLDVDIVPILYDGDPDLYGNLVSQDDGSFLKTCIPRHIEFIKKRKQVHPNDFAQVVRLIKYWAKRQKEANPNFRFKSFMIELILAKLSDQGESFSDYPEALQNFFTYLGQSDLKEMISFDDYYPPSAIPSFNDRVKVIDPVNEINNAAKLYTEENTRLIFEAAMDAGDAIDSAFYSRTKADTIRYWQKIFGPSFQI